MGVENTNAIQGDKHPIYAELDIAFSDGKNLYVVECKSGELKNKGVLTALSTNAQIFGGANAKCILISIDSNLGKGIQEKVKVLNIEFIFEDFKKILRIILITLGVDKLGRWCLVGVKPICYWILELKEIANLTKELEGILESD
ncbi:hypothetical protein [Helicobacter pylori]|uniref:hypothetical protein n=1 Tax=Helicobacter pylori TaxID=210 RepID=UPI001E568FD0|nr:hypothetical protein [Helicobacter pylori]